MLVTSFIKRIHDLTSLDTAKLDFISCLFAKMKSAILVTYVIYTAAVVNFTAGQLFLKDELPHVKLADNAILQGKVELSREGKQYYSFVGIPFATVKERFAEAELISEPNYNGIKEATSPGPICVQKLGLKFNEKVELVGEEQCLNLNVYIPARKDKASTAGFPVMVWIHGGGFYSGEGISYSPKYFMDTEEVIVVTINYRLNVFGFLSTGDDVVPGNNGLRDQVLALKWVQKFIKTFDGNPNDVTIFGESAGGASAHLLYLSPVTNGLFQKVIVQSGSGLAPYSYHPNPKSYAVKLADYLNCPTTASDSSQISSQEILHCLRKETPEKLLEAACNFMPRWPETYFPLHFGPVRESISNSTVPILTESPWAIAIDKTVSAKKVPLIIGVTEDEGATLFAGPVLSDPKLVTELNKNWNTIFPMVVGWDKFLSPNEQQIVAEKVRKFYFQDKPISLETRDRLGNLYSDILFDQSVRKAVVEIVQGANIAYLYRYMHRPPLSLFKLSGFSMPDEEAKKVGHGDELLLQFDLGIPGIISDPHHEEFSKNFVKLWTSFAVYGKPNHAFGSSSAVWKPVSIKEATGETPLKWFQISSNPEFKAEDNDFQARTKFWEKINKEHFQKYFQQSRQHKRTEL